MNTKLKKLSLPVFSDWPVGLQAMLRVDDELGKGHLSPRQLEIIRLRCSAVNKCEFCVQMHTQKALEAGISSEEVEQIISLQNLPADSLDDLLIQLADSATHLDEEQLGKIMPQMRDRFGTSPTILALFAVGQINSWNRIAVCAEFG